MVATEEKGVDCSAQGDPGAEIFWQELRTLYPRKALHLAAERGWSRQAGAGPGGSLLFGGFSLRGTCYIQFPPPIKSTCPPHLSISRLFWSQTDILFLNACWDVSG